MSCIFKEIRDFGEIFSIPYLVPSQLSGEPGQQCGLEEESGRLLPILPRSGELAEAGRSSRPSASSSHLLTHPARGHRGVFPESEISVIQTKTQAELKQLFIEKTSVNLNVTSLVHILILNVLVWRFFLAKTPPKRPKSCWILSPTNRTCKTVRVFYL